MSKKIKWDKTTVRAWHTMIAANHKVPITAWPPWAAQWAVNKLWKDAERPYLRVEHVHEYLASIAGTKRLNPFWASEADSAIQSKRLRMRKARRGEVDRLGQISRMVEILSNVIRTKLEAMYPDYKIVVQAYNYPRSPHLALDLRTGELIIEVVADTKLRHLLMQPQHPSYGGGIPFGVILKNGEDFILTIGSNLKYQEIPVPDDLSRILWPKDVAPLEPIFPELAA